MNTKVYPPDYTSEEKAWSDFLDKVCEKLKEESVTIQSETSYYYDPDSGGFFCGDCKPDRPDLEWVDNSIVCDNIKRCEECGTLLDCCLTYDGIKDILWSADQEESIGPDLAYQLLEAINMHSPRITERCGDFCYMPEEKPLMIKIGQLLGINCVMTRANSNESK